jgi:two-component system, cell cycle sensor histidine kinase PleC
MVQKWLRRPWVALKNLVRRDWEMRVTKDSPEAVDGVISAGPGADEVARREAARFAEQISLLYQGTLAIPGNLICAAIVAVAIWDTYPTGWLVAWVGATAAVVLLRLEVSRRYRRAAQTEADAPRWARRFVLGTLSSGLLWGAICLGLPMVGAERDYLFLAIVGAGMTAASLNWLAVYLPAYLSYALGFAFPLAAAFIVTPSREYVAVGALMLFYVAIVSGAAHIYSRSVRRTLELKIENAALNASLKSATAAVKEARLDKWGTFAQLSHELRTPLNAILGFSETMRDEVLGPHANVRYREYAADIHSSGQYLLTLASDLLELSQGETGMLTLNETEFDLARLIGECVRSVSGTAMDRGLGLTQVIAPRLPWLRGDETKVRQILLNLLSNAIKFTPTGDVSISASTAPDGAIALTVADSGIGMAPADVPRAFMPFVRLANQLTEPQDGAGLGLPLCKRLAEVHDAELTIESAIGMGTTVRLRFPPSRTCAPAQSGAAPGEILFSESVSAAARA